MPEGPYTSPWTTGEWFLITRLDNNAIVYAVVKNGEQPHTGIPHPTKRNARQWLKENGFTLKNQAKSE